MVTGDPFNDLGQAVQRLPERLCPFTFVNAFSTPRLARPPLVHPPQRSRLVELPQGHASVALLRSIDKSCIVPRARLALGQAPLAGDVTR
jgi:hypothetical protein